MLVANLADASCTYRAIFVGSVQNTVILPIADVILRLTVEIVQSRDRIALEVRGSGAHPPRCPAQQ